MNRSCQNRVICVPPNPGVPNLEADDPVLNLSSEATDGPEFIALAWPPGLDPFDPFVPDNPTDPPTICISPVSQEDADRCALRGSTTGHVNNPVNGGPPPALFFNAHQACPYLCADGSFFIQQVAAGQFTATSQAAADEQAAAYACLLASVNVFCLSNPETCCCNTPYTGHIQITGGNGPFSPNVVGNLPSGISVSQSADTRTIILSGTVATGGVFPFTLTVSDGVGNTIQKTVQLKVLCIGGNPGQGQVGVPFSFNFTGGGGDGGPYTFTSFAPPPPPGLGLDFSGLLHGTPQTVGTFVFGVGITDKNGNTCGIQVSMTIVGACNKDQSGSSFCPANPGITTHIDVPAGTFCAALGTNQNYLDSLAQQSMFQQLHDGQAAQGCLCPGPTMGTPSATQSGAMNINCGQFWVTDTAPPGPIFIGPGFFDWVSWWEINNGATLHGSFHAIPFDFAGPSILIFKV